MGYSPAVHERPSPARFTAQVGLLVSLSVVIRRVITPQISGLNLGGLPLLLSGLLLGWRGGAAVGALSDFLGSMLAGTHAYLPYYSVTAALTGALPPLLLSRGRPLQRTPSWVSLLAAIATTQLLTKVVLIAPFDAWLMHTPLALEVGKKLSVQLLHIPLYTVALRPLLDALLVHRTGSARPASLEPPGSPSGAMQQAPEAAATSHQGLTPPSRRG